MADKSFLTLVKILVEMVLLLVTFSTGIAVATTVGVTRAKIKVCIFSVGVSCSGGFYIFDDGLPSTCGYCLFLPIISVVLSLVFGTYRIIANLTKFGTLGLVTIISLVVLMALSILSLVTAAIITAGLSSFCNQLDCYGYDLRCRYYQNSVTWNNHYDGSSFYDMTKTAEAAAWVSFLSWSLLTVWCFVWDLIIQQRRSQSRQVSGAGKPSPSDVPI